MSKKNKCVICGEKTEKEICSAKCFKKYINTEEFQKQIDNLIDSLPKPRSPKNEKSNNI